MMLLNSYDCGTCGVLCLPCPLQGCGTFELVIVGDESFHDRRKYSWILTDINPITPLSINDSKWCADALFSYSIGAMA